jgi:SAM-dependent methyltransferase
MKATFEEYADGHALYGDDFSQDEIDEWFRDEKEGYFSLVDERKPGRYEYHALNWRHGFCHLPPTPFEHVLGLGSAFGDELQPVLDRAKRVTIVEPSDGFQNPKFEYVKPDASGLMPFPDSTFDLITSFGVLHHIPNVSTVVKEMARCTKPGGWLLIREPIVSMGNWDYPRPGGTRRERGIPQAIFRRIVLDAGLRIVHERRCMHSLVARVGARISRRDAVFNSTWMTAIDDYLSNIPVWSQRYHPATVIEKCRPGCVFLVVNKPGAQGY